MTTRTHTWTARNGQQATVTVDYSRTVEDEIAYADGDNINTGHRYVVESIGLTFVLGDVRVVGNCLQRLRPEIPADAQVIAKGAYGMLGNVGLQREPFEAIEAIIAELRAASTTPEMEELEAARKADHKSAIERSDRDDKEYFRQLRDGLCPRCGTYCCGDCLANR